jgi:hypothetical protein
MDYVCTNNWSALSKGPKGDQIDTGEQTAASIQSIHRDMVQVFSSSSFVLFYFILFFFL